MPRRQVDPIIAPVERESPNVYESEQLRFYRVVVDSLVTFSQSIEKIRQGEQRHKLLVMSAGLGFLQSGIAMTLGAIYRAVSDQPRSEFDRVNAERRELIALLENCLRLRGAA